MRNIFHFTLGTAIAAVLSTGLASGALAQTSSQEEGEVPGEARRSSDIVVTALRWETRLQDAPASITSLSDETLRAANLDSLNDLTRAVPSLTVTDSGPGQRRVTLRGIRSAGDAQVGIYYDETPLAGPPGTTSDPGGSQSDFKLFDVERVEVLRGPQGTLYGSGSVGGAIRLVTRKPDFEWGGRFDFTGTATEGGGLGYQINAALNVPLVDDVLAVRGVYFRRQDDGWVDNPGLGLKGINAENTDGGRILLRFIPTEGLTIDGAAHFLFTEGGASTWSPSAGKYNAVNASQVPYEDKQRIYSLTARAELGFADFIATTSYQDRDTLVTRDPTPLFLSFKNSACTTHFTADVCATPQGLAAFHAYVDSLVPVIYHQPQSVTDWVAEARLQSNGDSWLRWTIGAFYEDRDAKVLSEARRTSSTDGSQIAGAGPLLQRQVVDYLKQKAVFGEVSVSPVPELTVTGGLRYYDYEKIVGGDTTIPLDILRTRVAPFALYESKNNGWLYKVNVSWQPVDDLLIYGQAASGYRPGGVNQVLGLAEALAYTPDDVATYEGGIKATLADGAVTLNLGAYLTDWTGMQVSINSGSFIYLGNAGAARIKGLEAEATINPIEGLTFNINGTLTDAKLTEDQVPDGITPGATTARAGDKIPFIAPHTFSAAGQYEWALNASGSVTGLIRADVSYVGESHSDFRPNSANYRKVGDYTLANLRIGAKFEDFGAYFFVNNVFNTVARVSAGNTLGGTVETVTTVPPRTFGINLTGSF